MCSDTQLIYIYLVNDNVFRNYDVLQNVPDNAIAFNTGKVLVRY